MKRVLAGQVELAVDDRGAGSPIVFLHGFPLDHQMWQAQIEHFAPPFRVLAFDLRGFGASQVVPGVASMEQMADDVAAALEALDISQPVVLCGLSMGGYVGWQFARKHGGRLRALVACDTRSVADTPKAAAGRMKLVDHVLRAGSTEHVAEAMLPKLLAPNTAKQRPELVDQLRKTILAAKCEGIAAALRGMAARPDVGELLSQIGVPTLIVVGEHDAISSPDEMRRIAAAMPNGELAVIPSAGHMTPLENPTAFNGALDRFLSRL